MPTAQLLPNDPAFTPTGKDRITVSGVSTVTGQRLSGLERAELSRNLAQCDRGRRRATGASAGAPRAARRQRASALRACSATRSV